MLEEQQEVADLFKQAAREANLEKNGRINFATTGVDLTGDVEQGGRAVLHDPSPIWYLEFSYPIGEEEETEVYPITLRTSDFRNEQEAQDFLVQEIRRHTQPEA